MRVSVSATLTLGRGTAMALDHDCAYHRGPYCDPTQAEIDSAAGTCGECGAIREYDSYTHRFYCPNGHCDA